MNIYIDLQKTLYNFTFLFYDGKNFDKDMCIEVIRRANRRW